MKNFFKSLSFILMALMVYSCKKPHYTFSVKEIDIDNISDIKLTEERSGVIIDGDIWEMVFVDSFLVVQTEEAEGYLSVYNTRNFEKVASLGMKGRAKNEFSDPVYLLSQTYKRNGDSYVLVVDKDIYVKELNITQSIKQGHAVVAKVAESPTYSNNNRFLFLNNDLSNYILFKSGNSNVNEYRYDEYHLINTDDETDKELKLFPKKMQKDDESIPYYTFGMFLKHPDKNLFVQPMQFMEYMLFLDFERDTIYSSHVLDTPTFDDLCPDGRALTFSDAAVSKDFIFVIHATNDREEGRIYLDTLCVFNWDGDFLTAIKLDGDIISLTYDENNMRLYAVSFSNESTEEEIVSFDMSEVIKSIH